MQLLLLLLLSIAQAQTRVPETIVGNDQGVPAILASNGEKLATVFEPGVIQPGGLAVVETTTRGPGGIPGRENRPKNCFYCYYIPRSYGCLLCYGGTGQLCEPVEYFNGCSENYDSCSGCAVDLDCNSYCT